MPGKTLADVRHMIEHDLEHEKEHELERAKEGQVVKYLPENGSIRFATESLAGGPGSRVW